MAIGQPKTAKVQRRKVPIKTVAIITAAEEWR